MQNHEPILRSSGVNESEKILSLICDSTFLKLWVYPNVFMKQAKELCDVLVVFDEHIIIFSVKEVKFNPEKDLLTAWKRWKRKAIDDSITQVKRAEQWILKNPQSVFLDPKCEKRIPFDINPSNMKIHKVIVAHGAEDACKNEHNMAGSLAVVYADEFCSRTSDMPDFPFLVDLPRNDVIHVLDGVNLNVILGELDTITDLLFYFQAKEDAIKKYQSLSCTGEEDLLAHYITNFDVNKNQHFIGVNNNQYDGIHIEEGEWERFRTSAPYLRKKKEDEVSYFWDGIISKTADFAFNRETGGDSLFNNHNALIEMAKEPRFQRRALSEAIINAISSFPISEPEHFNRASSSFPSFDPFKRYVFVQLHVPKDMREDGREYREVRKEILKIACGAAKNAQPHLKKIIGIIIDNGSVDKTDGEDFLLLQCEEWSDKQKEYFNKVNEDWQFFKTPNKQVNLRTSYEYPPEHPPKFKKPGRNDPCICLSGLKFKRCCGKL